MIKGERILNDLKGLAAAKGIGRNRDRRAKELKAQGKQILGYFCCYPPQEMMTAAGVVPYRIMGNPHEPITLGYGCLESNVCPYACSCLDVGLKGGYDFLDGVITVHSCIHMEKLSHIWTHFLNPPYSCRLNVPHALRPASYDFFRQELATFKINLSEFVGKELPDRALHSAIRLHNQNRALVRELYQLREQEPPLLSGSEMTEVLVASQSIPVEESSRLIKSVIEEVRSRRVRPDKKTRVLLWGSEIDDAAFVRLIEDCGGNVVIDDTCLGTRPYWHDVEMTEDPLEGLSNRYLGKIPCPRTYRDYSGTRRGDLESRFKHIQDFARRFRIDAIILYITRFCDTHAYEAVDLTDYLKGIGLPVLQLELDYSTAGLASLKTRVQAFLEMVG